MSPMKPITMPRWVVVLVILGPLLFSGVGIVAVIAGGNETTAVCEAVGDLRDDVVLSLTKVRDRAISNADGDPTQIALIKEAYDGKDGLITIISDPTCP